MIRPTVQPEFGALPDRPREQVRAADVERAWSLLNWRARTALTDGLELAIAWHREQTLGRAPLERVHPVG